MNTYNISSEVLWKILSLSKRTLSFPNPTKLPRSLRISSTGASIESSWVSLIVPMKFPPIDIVLSEEMVISLLHLTAGYDGDIKIISNPSNYDLIIGNIKISQPKISRPLPDVENPQVDFVPAPPSLFEHLKIASFAVGADSKYQSQTGVWIINGFYYATNRVVVFRKGIPNKWNKLSNVYFSILTIPVIHSMGLNPTHIGLKDDSLWIAFEDGILFRTVSELHQNAEIPKLEKLILQSRSSSGVVDVSSWTDSIAEIEKLRGVIPKEDHIEITINNKQMRFAYAGSGRPSDKSDLKYESEIPIKAKGKCPIRLIVSSHWFFEGLSRFSRFIVKEKMIRFVEGSPDEEYLMASKIADID